MGEENEIQSMSVEYRGINGGLVIAGRIPSSAKEEVAEGARTTYFCGILVKLEWQENYLTRMVVPNEKSAKQIITLWSGTLATSSDQGIDRRKRQ